MKSLRSSAALGWAIATVLAVSGTACQNAGPSEIDLDRIGPDQVALTVEGMT